MSDPTGNYCHKLVMNMPVCCVLWVLSQGLATVGVGDLVRDEVKQGSVVGKQLKVRAA